MSIKFLVLGGGGIFGLGGGAGQCRFYFYWRGDFSESCPIMKERKIAHESHGG